MTIFTDTEPKRLSFRHIRIKTYFKKILGLKTAGFKLKLILAKLIKSLKKLTLGVRFFISKLKNRLLKLKFIKLAFVKSKNLSKTSPDKKTKKILLIKNNFAFRHAGLFLIAGFVLFSNIMTAKSSKIVTEDFMNEVFLSEAGAVSEADLSKLVTKISRFTPTPMKIKDPQKVVQRLIVKDTIVMTDGQYLSKPLVLATSNITQTATNETSSQQKKASITYYKILGGDTLGKIAAKFGISVSTLKSTNNLSSDYIKPGQTLTILSTNGVVHIVKRGETLSQIVANYKGDLRKTIDENNLGQGSTIYAGQKIVIVGGQKPQPVPAKTRVASASSRYSGNVFGVQVHTGRGPNHFPYGWCTWYVASRRYVPWIGNAGAWPGQAARYGYRVGYTPAAGAILVTHESYWGHVAYVESVNGNSVTISEMNYVGWGRVNYRTVPAHYGVYIY